MYETDDLTCQCQVFRCDGLQTRHLHQNEELEDTTMRKLQVNWNGIIIDQWTG